MAAGAGDGRTRSTASTTTASATPCIGTLITTAAAATTTSASSVFTERSVAAIEHLEDVRRHARCPGCTTATTGAISLFSILPGFRRAAHVGAGSAEPAISERDTKRR